MRTADAPAIWSIGARALSGRAMQIARVKKRSISATPFVVARRRSSSLVVRLSAAARTDLEEARLATALARARVGGTKV